MKRDGATESVWQNNIPEYISKVFVDLTETYDVIIVGGGMTGITTALLLQEAGKKCLVAEAQTLGFGTSSGTTAHLNTILDLTYDQIAKNFGEDNAKLVLKSTLESINLVNNNVDKFGIDCEFSRQQGYLFSQDETQSDDLDEAFTVSEKIGCRVAYSDTIPIPVDFKKALVFQQQGQIHPTKYLLGIAKAFEDAGGVIVQQCRVTNVHENEEKILEVETVQGTLLAHNLIYATHIPPGVNLLHFRCAPWRSYAMALQLNDDNYPDGVAYDMIDSYHYYRTLEMNGEKFLIAGGQDHKTAEEKNTDQCFVELEQYLRQYFDVKNVAYQWSSQYYVSADGLPYIGHLPGNPDNVFVATGYGGNGITFSHVAASVLTGLIVNKESEYEKLYNPSRVKPVAGFSEFVKNAADVTANLVSKIFPADKINDLDDMQNGEAKVVNYEGHSVAIYKDEDGIIHSVDPACTHIQCTVAWNQSEKAWECPCHGSRFSEHGEMLNAPARKDLARIDLQKYND
ncbi:MAG: FAD-dependent oxidoreductase [Ginsengibacter sp.]